MRPVPLPPGWGEAALFDAGEAAWPDAARSRDHGGAVLAWRGVAGACDMERLDKDPGTLPQSLGVPAAGFLGRWVAAEAAAKARGVPIVLWLKARGLGTEGLALHRVEAEGRVMAFCRAPPA
ncbi:MAG: hypothetical protein QOG31_826 [Thermoplasmata archaeon]|nr:hypothetical protein [Thermoplasmata archaeon]